jgi:HEPN domain-containing protein
LVVSVFGKFARKYFEEAVKDLARARRALSFEDYPSSVFYSQQADTELMVGLSICEYL